MYLEHKKLYRKPDLKMDVPLGLYEVELGKGKVVKTGMTLQLLLGQEWCQQRLKLLRN